MFGKKRREEAVAAETQAEAAEAIEATETDDESIDSDESLEQEEEPLRDADGDDWSRRD